MKSTAQKIVNKFYNGVKVIEEKFTDEKAVILAGIDRSIQLDKYSCGAQTVFAILNYYKLNIKIEDVLEELSVDKEEGVDTEPILNCFIKNGLSTEINDRAKLFHIKKAIRNGCPILITVDDWEHWCVIYGYSKEYIYILDSNYKTLLNKINLKEFIYRWDDNWICVVKPGV